MTDFDTADDLDTQLAELETSLGSATAMAAGFDAEMKRIHGTFSETGRNVASLERSLSKGLSRAFDGVILDGMKLTDALQTVATSMIDAAYKAAVTPVTNQLGGIVAGGLGSLFGGMSLFADGAALTQGRVTPFATGGVVNGPVSFAMRGGTGLMGEAGPEAIMPLSRGADGKLGVRTQGSSQPVSVVMNISTPDAASFQRSQSQIAARMSRALGSGARNR
ncbi:phage tail protein [Salipiger aestuarii]|uniref:phage tail tape measure protein n=1 Tax=Salipiger aestuarii TaxID=568098 RepID=UPI00025B4C75|nr:phage tail tape measure protein [Salipiger aestuarii]EIE49163.1 Phage minor tail protein [Citreicella sp. 357]KAA8609690.1 phage tail protein [Salipiger aestuarii]KAA8614022.1 phage tail protein [Salipiger aestuarii]